MNFTKIIVVLHFVATTYSCGNAIDRTEFQKEGYNVSRFVPSMNNKYLNFVEGAVNDYAKYLDIYSITNGFDSIQYRLWIQDYDVCQGSFYAEKLLIIKKYKTEPWKAILIKFGVGDMKNDTSKIVCKDIKNIKPQNWDYFLDSLNKLNVNKWVGKTLIPKNKYQGGQAENSMVLEIATTTQYRLITHNAPINVICEEQECKEVRSFLNLISKEFNLPAFKKYIGR